jgi:hypothetical protein
MGLFDRLLPKTPIRPAPATGKQPAAEPTPATNAPAPESASPDPSALPPVESAPVAPAPIAGGVLARLKQAREALEFKDAAGAMAIYQEVLASAGDRADILVTISGDLGVTGNTRQIIELIAPRYDAQRHGPATGFNLLQAYLAVRNPEAAQHVLDLLFTLNRPELEQRLLGFSNVIADMMLLEAEGAAVPDTPSGAAASGEAPGHAESARIDIVSISKPIWYYGLENVADLLPQKEGKLRRVAFGQLAVPGVKDFAEVMTKPEDDLGRLSRGIPLWLAETLFFSSNYNASAAIATLRREHYGLFNAELAPEQIRQLVDSTEGGIDYVFTGSLQQKNADYELVLRLWEVKKFRERKAFTIRWTPATADRVLAEFHAQLCAFMEFKAYPIGQGLRYSLPSTVRDYIEVLGSGLTLFLAEKQVLPLSQAAVPIEIADRVGAAAAQSETASLLLLGLHARARRLGLAEAQLPAALIGTPLVEQARQVLAV